jgi:hypothetical protein
MTQAEINICIGSFIGGLIGGFAGPALLQFCARARYAWNFYRKERAYLRQDRAFKEAYGTALLQHFQQKGRK